MLMKLTPDYGCHRQQKGAQISSKYVVVVDNYVFWMVLESDPTKHFSRQHKNFPFFTSKLGSVHTFKNLMQQTLKLNFQNWIERNSNVWSMVGWVSQIWTS